MRYMVMAVKRDIQSKPIRLAWELFNSVYHLIFFYKYSVYRDDLFCWSRVWSCWYCGQVM